jgi:putative hemolysin
VDDPGGSSYFIALVCLLLSGFFSGSESAIFSSDEVKLKSAYSGNTKAGKVVGLKRDPGSFLSSILFGNTLVNITFSSVIAVIVYSWFPKSKGIAELIAMIAGTILILIFGEITPKFLMGSNPESSALRVITVLSWFQAIMTPFSRVLVEVAAFFSKLLPENTEHTEDLSEARVLAALEYGEDTGAIGNAEKEIITGVIDSRGLEASEIMVPRPRMAAMQEDKSVLDVLKLMLKRGFSRIPVYLDSKDNITGIVNIKDLAVFIGERTANKADALSDIPAKQFACAPYFIPESKNVSDLLYEMKARGVHMAIVIDEFDGVSGLVTLEDVIEEIVGDIQDEYDLENREIVDFGNGRWRVPGSISLADFEGLTGIEIENEDCDSIAGLVMTFLERVPFPGDTFCLIDPKVCFTVQDVKGPRINKVLIERIEVETR